MKNVLIIALCGLGGLIVAGPIGAIVGILLYVLLSKR